MGVVPAHRPLKDCVEMIEPDRSGYFKLARDQVGHIQQFDGHGIDGHGGTAVHACGDMVVPCPLVRLR